MTSNESPRSDEQMKAALLPCPFCGYTADKCYHYSLLGEPAYEAYVYCCNNECLGRTHGFRGEGCTERAVRAWNTRAALQSPPQPKPAADWLEDLAHDNGNYMNICAICEVQFQGHKRRVSCKNCATADATKVVDEEQMAFKTFMEYMPHCVEIAISDSSDDETGHVDITKATKRVSNAIHDYILDCGGLLKTKLMGINYITEVQNKSTQPVERSDVVERVLDKVADALEDAIRHGNFYANVEKRLKDGLNAYYDYKEHTGSGVKNKTSTPLTQVGADTSGKSKDWLPATLQSRMCSTDSGSVTDVPCVQCDVVEKLHMIVEHYVGAEMSKHQASSVRDAMKYEIKAAIAAMQPCAVLGEDEAEVKQPSNATLHEKYAAWRKTETARGDIEVCNNSHDMLHTGYCGGYRDAITALNGGK